MAPSPTSWVRSPSATDEVNLQPRSALSARKVGAVAMLDRRRALVPPASQRWATTAYCWKIVRKLASTGHPRVPRSFDYDFFSLVTILPQQPLQNVDSAAFVPSSKDGVVIKMVIRFV